MKCLWSPSKEGTPHLPSSPKEFSITESSSVFSNLTIFSLKTVRSSWDRGTLLPCQLWTISCCLPFLTRIVVSSTIFVPTTPILWEPLLPLWIMHQEPLPQLVQRSLMNVQIWFFSFLVAFMATSLLIYGCVTAQIVCNDETPNPQGTIREQPLGSSPLSRQKPILYNFRPTLLLLKGVIPY